MHLDKTTEALFFPFIREVANPIRKPIRKKEQFIAFVENNNGIKDCYCDVYEFPFRGVIDKLYFDVDGVNNGFEEALPYAKKFYKFLVEKENLPVIPVASGKKGFNFHVLLMPDKYENAKDLLYRVQYSLIIKVFGDVTPVLVTDKNGKEHPTMRNKDGLIFLDPKVIGDVRRFCRIPGTLRPPENVNYCTYLPPKDFLDMDAEDIAIHMKKHHTYEYDFTGREFKRLKDFYIFEDLEKRLGNLPNERNANTTRFTIPSKPNKFLKNVLRPCLYRHITSVNPDNDARVAATIDLLNFFSEEEIFQIYSKLGWQDFDPEKTRYYIKKCKNYRPYSCKKLRQLGLPRQCCVE